MYICTQMTVHTHMYSSYRIKELCGEAQIVMQCQEGDSLQTHHDDLKHTGQQSRKRQIKHTHTSYIHTGNDAVLVNDVCQQNKHFSQSLVEHIL